MNDIENGAMAPDVICSRCEKGYEAFHNDQAYGCSADLNAERRSIRGHYGSAVADMTTFHFVSSHAWIEAGPPKSGSICDDCITDLEKRGLIEAQCD
jgi:hypothetical protein|tara:strand:- start:4110 stop:4400 length:291 start_codon:yes stop_codon:yes gene_type:complete